ncbi:MAG: hypothetical protein E5V86_32050, partial [Mesorhizobium sp.]
MALAHHDAAGRDQRRGREAELVGSEQRADHITISGYDGGTGASPLTSLKHA